MAASNAYVRGHNLVGMKISGTDTDLGRTAEDAVSIQMNVQSVELFSSQSLMAEDVGITQVGMELVINGIDGSLRNIQRLFGLPDAAFTGDLVVGAIDEQLDFNEDGIGATERFIYSEGPGPRSSTRRISAPRCKVKNVGPLQQGKTGWMLPTATWGVLRPDLDQAGAEQAILQITDITAS